jgi:hypothetical protein
MVTTPTIGQLAWGGPLNTALNDLQSQITATPPGVDWVPADQTYIGWPYDPAVMSGSTILVAGTLTITRVAVRAATTANSLSVSVTTAGSGLTAAQNFAGLYNSAGTLVAQTADQSAVWNSTGAKIMPLTAATAIPAGQFLLALLSNGTTPPTVGRASNAANNSVNFGLATSALRFATFGAGLTALPASFAPASMVVSAVSWWQGLR